MKNPLRTACLLLGATAYLAVGIPPLRADTVALPELGDASAATLSPAQERQIGEDFMRRARRGLAIVDDPLLSEYIQSLGLRLVAASDGPTQRFRFFLIQDSTINAFAVPGGFIGVNTGLLLAVHNEAELASVLAHETAHMWFGDLVTMRWFNDVWMKEVFANFMAAKIVNPSFPEVNHDLRFLYSHYP
ncbi:MAG: M48 family metalloprotease, partial [Pseudomonadota bacterium]